MWLSPVFIGSSNDTFSIFGEEIEKVSEIIPSDIGKSKDEIYRKHIFNVKLKSLYIVISN